MLKLFTKPVELTINDRPVTFKSIDDFEFAITARTALPLERINEAVASSTSWLDMETNALNVAIEHIHELTQDASESGEVTQQLKAINPMIFSSDNDWRDIFFALKKDQSAESSLYKQVALEGYLKYLSNRLAMIQAIRNKFELEDQIDSEAPSFRTGELEIEENVDSKSLGEELGLTDLKKGIPAVMEVHKGDEIVLLLAQYKCKVIIDDEITFVDNRDEEYPLTVGEHKIGRGSECTVRFMDTMHRISRLHLLINVKDDNTIELTDLSTYGTHYLKQAGS